MKRFLSLSQEEIKQLEKIAVRELGTTNKTGMVRYWINKYK